MTASRTNHMEYMEGMEALDSDVMDKVISAMDSYDYHRYTEAHVLAALSHDTRTPEDFAALLSPAAEPFLEEMAQAARAETRKHFGNCVNLFTPLYISNYCENHCIYCGFNCHNHIRRARLTAEEIELEMAAIAKTGLEEILILVGESRAKSDVRYLGEACRIARKYFKMVGLEVYPMNSEEYAYLHKCGADYVTVFQETYNSHKYETLHLAGHKRIFLIGSRAGAGIERRNERSCLLGRFWGWMISERMHLLQGCTPGICSGNIRRLRLRFPARVSGRSLIMIRSILRMCMNRSFFR